MVAHFAVLLRLLFFAGFLLVSLIAIFATPFLAFDTIFPSTALATLLAGAAPILALFLLTRHGQSISTVLAGAVETILKPRRTTWLLACFSVAIILRLLWIASVSADPTSDGATYLGLAQRLASGATYETAGAYAYWPPGFPLLLAPWITVLDDPLLAAQLFQLVATVLAITGCYLLGHNVGGEPVARISAAAIAIWPNFVMSADVPVKEIPIIAIMAFWLWIINWNKQKHVAALLVGALGGAAALIQPALLLLPAVQLGRDILARATLGSLIGRLALVLVGMAIVIAPWSIRNYAVFDEVVLITSTGGDNFYRANNPLATGGWTPEGEKPISHLDELERSARGYEYGIQWIKENPGAFLALAVKKQILLLGDDSVGPYDSLKRDAPDTTLAYAILKASSNAWWWGVWLVVVWWLFRQTLSRGLVDAKTGALLGMVLYVFVIHSIFESGSRYHLPFLPALCVLFAMALSATATLHRRPLAGSPKPATDQPTTNDLAPQTLSFLGVGAVATYAQYLLLVIFTSFGGLHPVPSSGLGYLLSAGLNYTLNYYFTFDCDRPHRWSLPRFALITLVGVGINTSVVAFMHNGLEFHYMTAQLVATVPVVAWNFTANRMWALSRLPGVPRRQTSA